jgi:asparagine synthase (glutamine-hydrolysing)
VYRYLALIWNSADTSATECAQSLLQRVSSFPARWQRALDQQGVVVFHSGLNEGASETRTLDSGSGVVLGRIFSRNIESTETARRITFDAAETAAIVATGGKRLFERYWGRYVAIVRNPRTGEVWVLRDPLGQLPCMLTTVKGVTIIFSDFEDCLKLSSLKFSVNWNYIAGILANPGILIRETALNEVSEVQLGERVRFSGASVERSIEWRVFDVACSDQILKVDDALSQLRATTRACIHTWASCYSGLIHNLSGGLDSSIVLSCLKDAPTRPPFTCLNYYGTGPSEDERQYAQLMARHVGADLVESRLDPSDVRLERITTLRRSARPWYYMYELEHGEVELQLARQKGANGLFSGSGGDGIFYQARAELAVADYFFDHGFGSGLLRTAVDAAQVSRKSIWPLLVRAIRARVLPKRFSPMAESGRPERTLVSTDVLESAAGKVEFDHPWFTRQATRGVPPGILWHVSTVSVPPVYYSSFGPEAAPERTMPLLSQPLVELCLRMPSYLLIRSGRDRAIARKAFAADLPEAIVKRTAKGRIDQYLRNILDANLEFVREFLLDGILVSRGLLNRENLDLYLTKERSPADFQYTEILQEHLCVEAWLRRSLGTALPESESAAAPPPVTNSCESEG